MSGIFFIELTPTIALVSHIAGITLDGDTIIMHDDDYKDHRNDTAGRIEIEMKLLATMAVYRTNTGICKVLCNGVELYTLKLKMEDNVARWCSYLEKIKMWASSV